MKRSIRRWLGLAVVPAALALFGAVAPAQAVTLPSCNDIPETGQTGSLTVTQQGDCIVNFDLNYPDGVTILITEGRLSLEKVSAENGEVFLSSTNSTITTKKISAGTTVRLIAGLQGGNADSSITVNGDVIANMKNIDTGNANIMIRAAGLVKTKDIKTNGTEGPASLRSGGIQIDADLSGENDIVFTIGADTDNGVNGNINTRSVNGGGTQVSTVESGVRITNGKTGSMGGITVTDAKNIKVGNSASRAGQIELNAQMGTITLPTGKLDASGDPGQGAGFIFLLADKIVTQDGTKITAKQENTALATVHQVVIAAKYIDFQGASGLDILADGKGPSETQPATVYVLPQGGITSTSTNSIAELRWTRTFTGDFFKHLGEVNFRGAADAPLTISANGDNSQIAITGYPITFAGGNLTIRARGTNLKHEVVMGFFDETKFDGTKGISFNNTGNVLINVRPETSMNGQGGDIQIQTDLLSFNTPDKITTLNARGPVGSTFGDGGTILITAKDTAVSSTSKVRFLADGPPNGTGKAQMLRNGRKAISFGFGLSDIKLGNKKGAIRLSAKGGGLLGNAGAIEVYSATGKIEVTNSIAITAVAPLTGDGGDVLILSPDTIFVEAFPIEDTKLALDVRGGEFTGNGGKIFINKASSISEISGINVNAVMKVEGGSFQLFGTMGSIDMNGVKCDQISTGYVAPKTVWQCNGASHGAEIADIVGQQLSPALQLQLSTRPDPNERVHLYAMDNIDDFEKFFARTGDLTQRVAGISVPAFRNSVVFANAYDGAGLQPVEQVFGAHANGNTLPAATMKKATALHEIGHQFEYIWDLNLEELPNDFEVPRLNDLAFLAGLTQCTQSFTNFSCQNNPDLQIQGQNNLQRYQILSLPQDNIELFPTVFQFLTCAGVCSDNPDLDAVTGLIFTHAVIPPGYMGDYVQQLLDSPPGAVK